MAEKSDTIIENAFADTVGRLANPLTGPAAFASIGFQMMRSSIVFWSELTESMIRVNTAMLKRGALQEPAASKPTTKAVKASVQPAPLNKARAAKPAKLLVVVSAPPNPSEVPDDLKAISGIGPKLEKVLNGMGISSFAHLAVLDAATIARIEDKLGFSGRIGRDDWIGQSKALSAAGKGA